MSNEQRSKRRQQQRQERNAHRELCAALTSNYRPCRNYAKEGKVLCHVHAQMNPVIMHMGRWL